MNHPALKGGELNPKRLKNLSRILGYEITKIPQLENDKLILYKNGKYQMHNEIFHTFRNRDDIEWILLLFQSVDTQIIENMKFPGFPEKSIQIGMIGDCGKNALYEAANIYIGTPNNQTARQNIQ